MIKKTVTKKPTISKRYGLVTDPKTRAVMDKMHEKRQLKEEYNADKKVGRQR